MKSKLIRGFTLLLSKSLVTTVSGFITLITVIQVIGIDEYGKYAGALSLILFLEQLLKVEIKLLLVKFSHKTNPDLYNTAFTVLLLASVLLVFVIAALNIIDIEQFDLYEGFGESLFLLSFVLPVGVLTEVPRAILEREMRFKVISKQELFSSLLQHLVCILLVLMFGSLKAIIISWYVYNISIFTLSIRAAKYIPSFSLNTLEIDKIKYHGRHLIAQNIILQSKKLVNPLIVGFYFGGEGVGIVSFCEKIVQGLSFFEKALRRVSVSAFGNFKKIDGKVSQFIKEGTLLQLLPVGIILLIVSLVIALIQMYTESNLWVWVNQLYPFLAIGFFFNTAFMISTLALQINGELKQITIFVVASNSLFWAAALLGVKYFGLIGYGLAELATIPTYLLLTKYTKKKFGRIFSNEIQAILICIPIALMWVHIKYLVIFSIPILILFPKMIVLYKELFQKLRPRS